MYQNLVVSLFYVTTNSLTVEHPVTASRYWVIWLVTYSTSGRQATNSTFPKPSDLLPATASFIAHSKPSLVAGIHKIAVMGLELHIVQSHFWHFKCGRHAAKTRSLYSIPHRAVKTVEAIDRDSLQWLRSHWDIVQCFFTAIPRTVYFYIGSVLKETSFNTEKQTHYGI